MTPGQCDRLMANAVRRAADTIQPNRSFLERVLDDALFAAIRDAHPGLHVMSSTSVPLRNWNAVDGAVGKVRGTREIDLAVCPPGQGSWPMLLSEQKVDSLEHTLFDLAKLLSMAAQDGLHGVYLVAGAKTKKFDEATPARGELFPRQPTGPIDTEELLTRADADWQWLCRDTGVRPDRLPCRFTLTPLLKAPVPVTGWQGHELRAVRVDVVASAGTFAL